MEQATRGVIEQIHAKAEEEGNDSFDLSSFIPMADVSGSMSGLPMEVCIALSILLSEVTSEDFKDMILTFSEDALWEDLKGCSTLVEKVRKLRRAPWGQSTNFEKAFSRIIKIVEENKISAKDTPGIVVFSDMQFNASYRPLTYYGTPESDAPDWATTYKTITKKFHDLGIRMDEGKPRDPPKIVFWNLRGDTDGFPVDAEQPGVTTMSGFNPSLMKFFLSGQMDTKEETVVDEETGEVTVVRKEVNPLENFKTVMADSRLDPIRAKLVLSTEGILAKYGADVDHNEATLFE